MNDINEKISALYDDELNQDEIDSLLKITSNDLMLQKRLSMYGMIGHALNVENNELISINSKQNAKKELFSNIWLTNSLTAAASILLTLTFVNNTDLSRMNISNSSTDQITSAINSKEAKEVVVKSEEFLTDYIMRVINDPNFMNTNKPMDLRNVGFMTNSAKSSVYSRGKENFKIRIEKNNFGLKKIRYWKHENKMIYLVPISNDRTVTIYGNIPLSTAVSIAKSIT